MKTDGTPYGWLDLLAPGHQVVLRNQIKPGYSVMYLANVIDRFDSIVTIQVPWDGPVKSVRFDLNGIPTERSQIGRLTIQEATVANQEAVLDQHTRRAYLQRIYSVLEPMSRAESDSSFSTPFRISAIKLQALGRAFRVYDPAIPDLPKGSALYRMVKLVSFSLRVEQQVSDQLHDISCEHDPGPVCNYDI